MPAVLAWPYATQQRDVPTRWYASSRWPSTTHASSSDWCSDSPHLTPRAALQERSAKRLAEERGGLNPSPAKRWPAGGLTCSEHCRDLHAPGPGNSACEARGPSSSLGQLGRRFGGRPTLNLVVCPTLAISCEGRTLLPWSLVAASPWRPAVTMPLLASKPPLVSFIALLGGPARPLG